jgi:hypothetical protein
MKYYYLHPFKPQYFFPQGYKKHKFFLNFFSPYSIIGKISWFLFNTMALYRVFFTKKNIEKSIPETKIRNILGHNPLMAFNTGTPGIEQKITALGIYNDSEFFIKYGQSKIASRNISNEFFILKHISHINFVPKVLDFYENKNHVLLKTNVLKGNRISKGPIEKKLILQMFTIADQKIQCPRSMSSSLKLVFAHGDFCPWNMMYCENQFLIYDWEMAGNYILGYDLFTYVFQTNFLLNPKSTVQNIIKDNIKVIEFYFSYFNVFNWKDYLIVFTQEKVKLETLKGDNSMIREYLKLLEYVEKT